MNEGTTIRAKYKGYCHRCYFTIFKGELINFNGKPFHLDCGTALTDELPRHQNPDSKRFYGPIKRKDMKKLLEMRERVATS